MPYPFDPDVPRFATVDIVRATGWSIGNLNRATTGDPPAIRPDRPAGGTGRAHLFSYRRAMQFAISGVLIELGFKLNHAARIAYGFTDVGDAERAPLELFEDACTVLVAYRKRELGEVKRMVLPSPNSAGTPMSDAFLSGPYGRQPAVKLVWLDFVDRELRAALGLS